MSGFKDMWGALELRARIAIAAGVVAIALAVIALGVWAYRPAYQVLFADLAPRDAAAMTAELDKLKAPYRLGGDGNTILVPQDQVYKLRLKLMGKDAPLYGAVGFEVFNNADLGMSEFVQKVNYQRAVQGELTRTIQALDEVQSARVHLAIPEQGLFKHGESRAKASVTLTVKPGAVLGAEQVIGIQRLVAASVPDVTPADVTVLDQHGMALTRTGADAASGSASAQLDAKRGTEDYLLRKVTQVLDRTFGPGQAIASVDVVLNLDQAKVTTEEVLPGRTRGAAQGGPAGVVVRERHSVQGADGGTGGAPKATALPESSTSEAEYQVGRRVEQVAVASGTVRRMTVAVLVRQALTPAQAGELKDIVGSALGISMQRGDAVVVHSMDQFGMHQSDAGTVAAAHAQAAPPARTAAATPPTFQWWWPAVAAAALLMALGLVLRRPPRMPRLQPVQLDDAARAEALHQVRTWIDTDITTPVWEARP